VCDGALERRREFAHVGNGDRFNALSLRAVLAMSEDAPKTAAEKALSRFALVQKTTSRDYSISALMP
jgi:hypothetical protein